MLNTLPHMPVVCCKFDVPRRRPVLGTCVPILFFELAAEPSQVSLILKTLQKLPKVDDESCINMVVSIKNGQRTNKEEIHSIPFRRIYALKNEIKKKSLQHPVFPGSSPSKFLNLCSTHQWLSPVEHDACSTWLNHWSVEHASRSTRLSSSYVEGASCSTDQ